MSYARGGGTVLGDAWNDYTSTGRGPANGSITSPNGDILLFDAYGNAEGSIPQKGSGSDSAVNQDPSSAFYGWTNLQIAAYWAKQGVIVLTDSLRAAGVVKPGDSVPTVTQADVDKNQAALVATADKDPVVSAAVSTLATGAFGSTVAAQSAVNQAADDIKLQQDGQLFADAIEADGGIFRDSPNTNEPPEVLADLQTKAQWIADYVARAKAGGGAGMSPDDAVAAGVLSASAADKIKRGIVTARPVSTRLPAVAQADSGIFLSNGVYVDATGAVIPDDVLQQLGLPMPSSSTDLAPAPIVNIDVAPVPQAPLSTSVVPSPAPSRPVKGLLIGAALLGLGVLLVRES